MIGLGLAMTSFFAGLGIWLGGVRPYLSRHGGVVATGATWAVSAWADWQQCSDFAKVHNDPQAAVWARRFLLTQAGILTGIILILCKV